MNKIKSSGNGKPKGKTPSLISSKNGRPERVDVLRKSNCKRCKIELTKGQTAIEIPQLGQAYSHVIRICDDCYAKVLDQTEKDLQEIRSL